MNYLDIILAIPLVWAIYRGFTKGLVIEIASLIALILGVYGGIHFSYFISDKLNLSSPFSPLISFAITFLIIVIVIFLLAKLLEKSINLLALGFLNKLAGAFFGLLKMAFLLSILLLFINKIDLKISIVPEKTRKESLLYPTLSAFAPYIIPKLNFEKIQKKMETPPVIPMSTGEAGIHK
ncbi:MAG: CvpA family protein [Bacteroidales bacterium]